MDPDAYGDESEQASSMHRQPSACDGFGVGDEQDVVQRQPSTYDGFGGEDAVQTEPSVYGFDTTAELDCETAETRAQSLGLRRTSAVASSSGLVPRRLSSHVERKTAGSLWLTFVATFLRVAIYYVDLGTSSGPRPSG